MLPVIRKESPLIGVPEAGQQDKGEAEPEQLNFEATTCQTQLREDLMSQ